MCWGFAAHTALLAIPQAADDQIGRIATTRSCCTSGRGRCQLAGLGFRLFRGRGAGLPHLGVVALDLALLGEADCLADAVAQVEELRPAGLATATYDDLRDEWRVQREDALDAFVVHDPADGERLVDPAALAHE